VPAEDLEKNLPALSFTLVMPGDPRRRAPADLERRLVEADTARGATRREFLRLF